MIFAFEFLKTNLIDEFVSFLRQCLTTVQDNPRYYEGQVQEHCLVANTLLAYYLNLARSESDKLARENYIGNALENQFKEAHYEFNTVLKDDPNNVPCLLSSASLYFDTKDFSKALEIYQKILTLAPDLKPDVRNSIGHCFYRLGMLEEARYTFCRVLERDENNVEALISLSIMDWNMFKNTTLELSKEEREIYLKNANARLNKAFKLEPTNSVVNITMADRLFKREDYKK
ncbi:hypothetical protein HK099_003195, partial [Clydaea vesicula]